MAGAGFFSGAALSCVAHDHQAAANALAVRSAFIAVSGLAILVFGSKSIGWHLRFAMNVMSALGDPLSLVNTYEGLLQALQGGEPAELLLAEPEEVVAGNGDLVLGSGNNT